MGNKVELNTNGNAVLIFENGEFLIGKGVGFCGKTIGEICFNTAMTGYQEIITDPSYSGQVINFTFSHIGNVGCNLDDTESSKIYCNGVIMREFPTNNSNYRSQVNLNDWLTENGVTGICNIDTRAITKYIRKNSALMVMIYHGRVGEIVDIVELLKELQKVPNLDNAELTKDISTKEIYKWKDGEFDFDVNKYKSQSKFDYKIAVIDYGVKKNILRCMTKIGLEPFIFPSDVGIDEIIKFNPDGVFLSNGPGDPFATSKYTSEFIRKLIDLDTPIFGICMGHQLISSACGLKTVRMKQGHRGANHPVKNLVTGMVEITSQNHSFAVLEEGLPSNIVVTHKSLFDGSVAGIKMLDKPVFSVQYHPESSPGPSDSRYLFLQFKDSIASKKSKKK